MHAVTKEILTNYQVRKTRRQKERFRGFLISELEKRGVAASVEVSPVIQSANVVVGDVASARFIFTAHYDTQPELPYPMVLSPFGFRGILSQLYLGVLVFATGFALMFILTRLFSGLMSLRFSGAAFSLIFMYALMFGKANKHTANDNTSGVCVLVEALMTLPEAVRKQAAFVFFDNEEIGLLGAADFLKKHKRQIEQTPLINFDCVGNGEVLAFMGHRALFADEAVSDGIRGVISAFAGSPAFMGIETSLFEAPRMQYTSDQMLFKKALGVAAFKKSRWLGLHINRIHTRRDTICGERNVEALYAFIKGLLTGIPG